MASGPESKRARSDAAGYPAPSAPEKVRSEQQAFSTQSREGYFGDPDKAVTKSNASGEPRIVLSERYGQHATAAAADKHDEERSEQLKGCSGRYTDKVTIITGAARGIGEGCVRVFFEAGSNVVIADRSEDSGSKFAQELNDSGRPNKAIFVRVDVSVVSDLESLVNKTIEHFGRLDCLINNAGWHPPPHPIDEFSIDSMQDLMQLNFISYFALTKFSLPHLRKTKGNIINMSSLVGAFGQAKATTYAATKGATTAFTKALAIDEAQNGVRANTVSPGNVWTPLWKAGADAEADPVAARIAGERVQVMKRMGTTIEAGRLCLCIAADLTFTTGVDHILSGGAEIGYGLK